MHHVRPLLLRSLWLCWATDFLCSLPGCFVSPTLRVISDVRQWLVACLDSILLVGKGRDSQQKRLKLSEYIGCPMHVVQVCNCQARW